MSKVYGKTDKSIKAKTGETFAIELEANPTTGYQWQADVDPEKVKLLDTNYESPGHAIGASGKERLTFQSLSEGDTTISLKYKRAWEEESIDSVEIKLQSQK